MLTVINHKRFEINELTTSIRQVTAQVCAKHNVAYGSNTYVDNVRGFLYS